MSSTLRPRQIVLFFGLLLAGYLGVFYWIEHRRQARGPWETGFYILPNGTPAVSIDQKSLGIQGVRLQFPGETALASHGQPQILTLDHPGMEPAFGAIIYEDLTFLPGVVTFNLFGHEVEILPKSLIINKKEIPWQSGLVIDLDPASKPATPPRPPPGGTRDRASESL